ncbi:MAG: type 1 glutamine amidotransferase [Myxococcota bacterium]
MRLLVLDAYPREGREALAGAGGTEAGRLYARLLRAIEPAAEIDVATPADADAALPRGAALGDFDGAVWTGSSLTIHRADDARVRRQVDLARALLSAGVPNFGSCWAAQLAVVAGGGECGANPRGREFGVARRIEATTAGRDHPLYRGKPPLFDAFTSHADEITRLPEGATRLAGNDFSAVQAVDVAFPRARFWAVQYHPEYDPHEVASLCRLRRQELVDQGTFPDAAAADAYVDDLEALHAGRAPARPETLSAEIRLLDVAERTVEVRNWLDRQVRPTSRP